MIITRFIVIVSSIALSVWVVAFINNIPHAVVEINGIKLNETKNDLLFEKGEPNQKQEFWTYNDNRTSYLILFIDDHVSSILAADNLGINFPTSIEQNLHVSQWTKLDDLFSKLGQADRTDETNDHLSKTFYFNKYNAFFEYSHGQITAVGAFNPNSTLRFKRDK